MVKSEPKFMRELHKIRAEITKEWRGKSAREIVRSIRNEAGKSKCSKRTKRR